VAKLFLANSLRGRADRSPRLLRLLWAMEGVLIGALAALSRMVSPDRASAAGRRLMRALGPHLAKTQVFRRNLQIAFPEKSAQELDELLREIWGNMGAILAEYPHLETICRREAAERLEIIKKGNSRVFSDARSPAVFVSAHLANWEIAAGSVVFVGVPLTGIYTPIQNPWMDRMLYRARLALGCGMVKREGAVRQLMKALRKGISVGLLVDQRVDAGEPVPFFGHDMNTSMTPAQLALRLGCELIPVQVQRRAGARYRVIFHEPVEVDDASADEHEKMLQMTRKLNALFESWIRERPQEWMCSKRRWPKDLAI
jgi:KDO2-lipid IV(A) lauroyltransferase